MKRLHKRTRKIPRFELVLGCARLIGSHQVDTFLPMKQNYHLGCHSWSHLKKECLHDPSSHQVIYFSPRGTIFDNIHHCVDQKYSNCGLFVENQK